LIARAKSLPRAVAVLFMAFLTLAAALAVPAGMAVFAQDVSQMDNEEQKDWLTSFVQDRLSTPERQIRLSNIDGILGSDVSIREITISDAEGVWLRVNNAQLNWNQGALFLGRLEVRSLTADSVEYLRNAIPNDQVDLPPPEAGTLEIPQFPVAVILEELSIPRITFGEQVFGLGSEISLNGAITLEGGNLDAELGIQRLDGPGGSLDLNVNYLREAATIDLGLTLEEPENGVLANLLNIEGRPAMQLSLNGSGPVANLRTELVLNANGQTALSGVSMVTQTAEGFSIDADLGGPLSTLMAEPYRPFFGPETALTAKALVRSAGGLSISDLRLSGGQMSLEASAETTPDNFLRQLHLDAVITDPAGETVTLPVPGSSTVLQNARFAIEFGNENSENWSATVTADGFRTGDFGARTLALTLGGVAANLSDPATRRLTFNGDGALSGIDASEEVKAALGDEIGLGVAGLWNAGEPVQLAEFRVAGQSLSTVLSGVLDGLDFNGDIGIETTSIAPFSGLAGRELNGALGLAANGTISPVSGGFNLTLDGTGTNLSIDDEVADRLMAGTVTLSGRVARDTTGLTADDFRLGNEQIQLTADGTYSNAAADFTFDLGLSDLALLTPDAAGAVTVTGTARGQEGVLDLTLDARLPTGQLAGRDFGDGRLAFAGQSNADGLTGMISGDGLLDGFRTTLAGNIGINQTGQTLSGLDFQAGGTRLTGGLTRNQDGLIDGDLTLAAPDISVAAALALMEAEGAANAEISLSHDGTVQNAEMRGDVRGLRVNDIAVGSADIEANIVDLFGVPVVDGTINGRNLAAAGVTVETLTARANQSGDTTAFDGQARLATGTDVDIAGSLSPLAGGYRLALDRAQLTQGQLSARLAQPTVLAVNGSTISLDAVRFDVGSGSLTATGSAGEALDIDLDINRLPLSIANAVVPSLGLAGTLDGRASIGGTGSDPQVTFEANASSIDAAAIGEFGIAPLSVNASGRYGGNAVTLTSLTANGAQGLTVTGSGRVPLSGNGLDVRLNGSAPLALANRFVADRGGQLSGTVSLNAQVSGSLSAPQFGGTVSTSGAGYIDPELNMRLQNITGTARLTGENVVIDTLTAQLATGGSVSGSGSVRLSNGFPSNVNIALNSARYTDGTLFVATMSGNLALTGNLTGSPLLSGNVLVEEANITVPSNFGGGAQLIDVRHVNTPRAVDETLARAHIDDRSGAPIPQTRPSGVVLDVTVNAPNQIFIRGRGLDAEVGGSVRLRGPLNDIQPVGAFELNRGRLAILGQRVTFESGSVTLVGDLDPLLNFVARTQGEDITVFVTVSGRASDIDVSFTSTPMLPQDEVLARLIFNRSMGELSPLQLARLAAAAAELAGGGGDSLVDSLRGAAGLDDLDIVTDDQGNVAVQAGTYIQDNVYLGVQAGAGGQSKVTINLDVTDNLKVTGAAGQDGESSLGVFYEADY